MVRYIFLSFRAKLRNLAGGHPGSMETLRLRLARDDGKEVQDEGGSESIQESLLLIWVGFTESPVP